MIFKIFLIILCLLLPFVVYGSVIINEIAWMGTEISYNDEWIELYNNGGEIINLNGWILKAEDETPEIALTGAISAKGFYLLERTNDETVPEISADLIYKGVLSNSGENLKLYDNSGNLIDEANHSSGWFAGDNSTKQTMEKINSSVSENDSQNWQTSQNSNGTPKTQNSKLVEVKPLQAPQATEAETEEKDNLPEVQPRAVEAVNYPTGIVFSEILPSPEDPDSENEWTVPTNEHFLCL